MYPSICVIQLLRTLQSQHRQSTDQLCFLARLKLLFSYIHSHFQTYLYVYIWIPWLWEPCDTFYFNTVFVSISHRILWVVAPGCMYVCIIYIYILYIMKWSDEFDRQGRPQGGGRPKFSVVFFVKNYMMRPHMDTVSYLGPFKVIVRILVS